MRIKKIIETKSEIVETDDPEYPTYRRHSKDNWENLMGSSWELHYSCKDIEALYQKFKNT